MAEFRKIGAKSYYDYLPKLAHGCGDIWRDLPSFGVLGSRPIAGVVVSAACDLTQRKTETVTFLPVIPVGQYFSTIGVLPSVRQRVHGLLSAGRLSVLTSWQGDGFAPPFPDEVRTAIERINSHLTAKKRGEKEIAALEAAAAGLRIVSLIAEGELVEPEPQDLALVFGREWEQIKADIARNAYSADLHFLPADGQVVEVSGVHRHSVALIRYPLTIPISVLDLAASTDDRLWPDAVAREVRRTPAVALTAIARPMKMLSMRSEFTSDLLSRYLAIYSRYGSPDFTNATIKRFSEEIDSR